MTAVWWLDGLVPCDLVNGKHAVGYMGHCYALAGRRFGAFGKRIMYWHGTVIIVDGSESASAGRRGTTCHIHAETNNGL
jgi:hypothetical protein